MDPLQRPVTGPLLEELFGRGLITWEEKEEALGLLLPPKRAIDRIQGVLLGLGSGLCLAGVLFFFAYNWAAMPAWSKLALLQGGLVLAALEARRRGLDTLPGQVLLSFAGGLVGIHMAVFGQIYQTGADAWQLFVAWAALTAPWVILSRFAPFLAGWMIVADIGLAAWLQDHQSMLGQFGSHDSTIPLALALVHTVALFAQEPVSWFRSPGRGGAWIRWFLLAGAGCGAIAALTNGSLFAPFARGSLQSWMALALVGILARAGWTRFRHRDPDLISVTLLTLNVLAAVLIELFQGMAQMFDHHDFVAFSFFYGVLALGATGLVSVFLTGLARRMREEASHGG